MKQILIIDDDIYIGNMLEEVLQKEGYRVLRAYSGTEAILLLSCASPDLILLDLMLPGLSGEELLPRIKTIPVIVVSAKADLDSKVALLLEGAADYITKPFEIRELLARITAALRKCALSAGDILYFDNLCFDAAARTVFLSESERISPADPPGSNTALRSYAGTPCLHPSNNAMAAKRTRLTRTEAAILKILMLHPSQVISKSHLLELISEDTPDCTDQSLKTHVSNLRKKLREIGGREYIEAVWGIGFHLIS